MAQLAKYLGLSWATNQVRSFVATTDWYHLGWQCFWYLPLFGFIMYHLTNPHWDSYMIALVVWGAMMFMGVILLYVRAIRRQKHERVPTPETYLRFVSEEAA